MTMKRVTAMTNACLAAAGLVATAALAYGVAFVAFPPVRPRLAFRDPVPCRRPPTRPAQDPSPIWTQKLGDVTDHPKLRFDGTLVGTMISSRPSSTFAVVNTSDGQVLVRPGDAVQDARLLSVAAGTAMFMLGGQPIPRNIERISK